MILGDGNDLAKKARHILGVSWENIVSKHLTYSNAQSAHTYIDPHEHPVVLPHVLHFRHVPFRTKVKFPHSPQASPS
jgi:hypothetical protein